MSQPNEINDEIKEKLKHLFGCHVMKTGNYISVYALCDQDIYDEAEKKARTILEPYKRKYIVFLMTEKEYQESRS
jgi:hypothetical protein